MAGLDLERAPRLRRRAAMLEEQAEHAVDPAKARELARAMRLRAADLEGAAEVAPDELLRDLSTQPI